MTSQQSMSREAYTRWYESHCPTEVWDSRYTWGICVIMLYWLI